MRASVLVRAPDGVLHELGPGDIIGRLTTASLQVDDARVSEAHAMVSLRGGELRLLALRALFAVDGKPLRELTLAPGQRIELARDLSIEVEDVDVPTEVLVLEYPGLGRQALPGACWLLTRPSPRLSSRHTPGAQATFWSAGSSWKVRLGERAPEELAPGWTAEIDGGTARAILRPVAGASRAATRLAGRVDAPLRIVSYFDNVVIERGGVTELKLTGLSARLISELIEVGAPVAWEPLARQLWPHDADAPAALRKRWDMALYRLRRKLSSRSLRPDLVAPDGSGRILLHLEAGDEVVDADGPTS